MLILLALSCAVDATEGPANAFLAAEAQTGVPYELLLAIAAAETGVQRVEGVEEFPGQAVGWGVMGLRDDVLEKASKLAGYDVEVVRRNDDANVMAAAALLAGYAELGGINTNDLSAWAPVVAQYSGIRDEEGRREYVWYEVYEQLKRGVEVEGFRSEPQIDMPSYPPPSRTAARAGDSSTVWTASPNYNSRSGAGVDYVIIHACEGSYSGCWSWLTDSSSSVSSHYVVNSDGSEVRQLVDEDNRAWHISASYDCGYNGNEDCGTNGQSMNTISVGIEHAGYTSQTSWDKGLLARSAEIACGVTQRHGVPIDSYHIVAHGQLQPWNRSDPGSGWPWSSYLDQVRTACGSSGSSSSGSSSSGSSSSGSSSSGSSSSGSSSSSLPTNKSFVIDSNNGANDTSAYWIEVSSAWFSSARTSGYYNTGYWAAPTEGVSDPAHFRFETDQERCYTVEAWWSAGSDRPSSITWVGWDESDHEVGRATVNQQTNGGRWNSLGNWTFPAGSNQVLLSRWAGTGKYAIADAVRLTPC
jgi:N-acetyl-anhydromuramyl-L-alanine amidase AmpD